MKNNQTGAKSSTSHVLNVDKTETNNNPGETKLLPEPDTTGIDTKADKTSQEISPIEHKLN